MHAAQTMRENRNSTTARQAPRQLQGSAVQGQVQRIPLWARVGGATTPLQAKLTVNQPVAPAENEDTGQPLPLAPRRAFEAAFRTDLGQVRVHNDTQAASWAHALRAQAFTLGQHVYFGAGKFRPDTLKGRYLLAHELAHVAQLRPAMPSAASNDLEQDARRMALEALTGRAQPAAHFHDGRSIHRLGEPENIPDLTFIAQAQPGDNGFIQSALDYHRAWGLNPRSVASMEAIVNTLSSGRGTINRLRIVTHANVDNLFLELFSGSVRGIRQEQLAAFGFSDAEGLASILRTAGLRFLFPDRTAQALAALRGGPHAAVLTPFGLDAPGSTPSGDVADLIRRSLDLLLLGLAIVEVDPGGGAQAVALSAAQRTTLSTAMGTILTDLSGRITASGGTVAPAGPPGPARAPITAQQVQALLSAIAGLTLSDLGWTSVSITLPAEMLQDLRAANTAIAGGLRGKLTALKARFNSRSTIDIRGCRVGQNPDYLRSVQCFFGRSGDLPAVTAPEWFQSFPSFGFHTLADEAGIDSAASSGFSVGTDTLIGSDVQTAIQSWSDLSGARSQLAFWATLFSAGAEVFVAMNWRSSLPALQMESRMGDLNTASFAQVLQRLADVFKVPGSARPNTAQITALEQKQPLAQRLVQAEGRLQVLQGQASPDQTDLQALQQELAAIRQLLAPTTAGTTTSPAAPPSAPSAGPAPAPAAGTPVTTAQLQQEIQPLQQTLRTQLAAIAPFLQAVAGKLSHSNAALRFYLNLGWVLPVQSASSPESIFLLVMDAHKNQAIRRWAAVQWTGNIPRTAAALAGVIENVATRRYAALSNSHGGPGLQVVFAPTPAYMSHIVVLNGGNFSCTAQGSNATMRARAAQAQTGGVTDPLQGL